MPNYLRRTNRGKKGRRPLPAMTPAVPLRVKHRVTAEADVLAAAPGPADAPVSYRELAARVNCPVKARVRRAAEALIACGKLIRVGGLIRRAP